MATWQQAIRQDSEAFQGFTSMLETLKEQAQREQDEATSIEEAKAAVKAKKFLAYLSSQLTMDTREEQAHGRAFGPPARKLHSA